MLLGGMCTSSLRNEKDSPLWCDLTLRCISDITFNYNYIKIKMLEWFKVFDQATFMQDFGSLEFRKFNPFFKIEQ